MRRVLAKASKKSSYSIFFLCHIVPYKIYLKHNDDTALTVMEVESVPNHDQSQNTENKYEYGERSPDGQTEDPLCGLFG